MIATLAKVPLAFGSVHKRGRTPTDQSPVWQGPSHFQWDACALSLTPPITSGDCDYASDSLSHASNHSLGSLYTPSLLDLSPLAVHPLPNPSHMYSTRRGGRYRGRDGPRGRAGRSWEVTL